MILDFDSNPNLTPEDKLHSLKESTQRALEESSNTTERLYKALLNALGAEASSLSKGIQSLSERLEEEAKLLAETIADFVARLEAAEERLDTLEARWTAPDAPTEDGAYRLTVTVTDGEPVYTWEAV